MKRFFEKIFLCFLVMLCVTTLVGCSNNNNQLSNKKNNENSSLQNGSLEVSETFLDIVDKTNTAIEDTISKINLLNEYADETSNESIAKNLAYLLDRSLITRNFDTLLSDLDVELLKVYNDNSNYFYISTDDLDDSLDFFFICEDDEIFTYYGFKITYENSEIQTIEFKLLESDDGETNSILIGKMLFDVKNNTFYTFSGKPINSENVSNYNFLTSGNMTSQDFRKVKWEYSWSVLFDFNDEENPYVEHFENQANEVIPNFKDDVLNFDFNECYYNQAICDSNFEDEKYIENQELFSDINNTYISFDDNKKQLSVGEETNA
jgi:hypothetical protein